MIGRKQEADELRRLYERNRAELGLSQEEPDGGSVR